MGFRGGPWPNAVRRFDTMFETNDQGVLPILYLGEAPCAFSQVENHGADWLL